MKERSSGAARPLYSKKLTLVALAVGLCAAAFNAKADYSTHPKAHEFMLHMGEKHNFSYEKLKRVLAQVEKRQDIIDLMNRPAEGTMTWERYRKIFIKPGDSDKRVAQAVELAEANWDALMRAEKEFGVPAHVISAVIAVETRSGHYMGKHRVIDALATLAFDYPRRSTFFTKELEYFVNIAFDEGKDFFEPVGSYAGAMGYGQFMPSSYSAYAIDFDGDGKRDIWDNPVDAIGSIGFYLAKHGWRTGEPVSTQDFIFEGSREALEALVSARLKPNTTIGELADQGLVEFSGLPRDAKARVFKLDDQIWLGYSNFYAWSRYNHSSLYVQASYELSLILEGEFERLKK